MEPRNLEEFIDEIEWLFHPEPDEDGIVPRELPNKRIREHHKLDMSYMESFDWEGSSVHRYTRLCRSEEERIHVLTRNRDVPDRLFDAALKLFADSISEYHEKKEHAPPLMAWPRRRPVQGGLRVYPPVILTFWAGFETFARYSSERLIVTARHLPVEVSDFLSEQEKYVDPRGDVSVRTRYRSVLDRYTVFLKYACDFSVSKGETYWQELVKAKELRDYYMHLDVTYPRLITSNEVLSHVEAILLAIIIPSAKLQRTLMLGIYWLYDIWTTLHEYNVEYAERPLLMNWHLKEEYQFHCNFANVEPERFKPCPDRFEERTATKGIEGDYTR